MIQQVTSETLMQAANIHAISWRDSHKNVCSEEFIEIHTVERQKSYLASEIAKGAQFYMLTADKPVGIVSIKNNLIGDLYVLPEEQNKGYGTQLLNFAVEKCGGIATLWILNSNNGARRLYERKGFKATGKRIEHTNGVYEIELCRIENSQTTLVK